MSHVWRMLRACSFIFPFFQAEQAALDARRAKLSTKRYPVKREEIQARQSFKPGEVIDLTEYVLYTPNTPNKRD